MASVRWDPDAVEFIESHPGMTAAAIAVVLGRWKATSTELRATE